MCGYFVSNDPTVTRSYSERIEKLLRFRGPDSSSGLMQVGRWSLYHSRLAIIDVEGDNSNQPYFDASGGILVFNGEILNYKSLSKQHLSAELPSDTEVLSQLIVSGKLCLNDLDGFFSFCYIDAEGTLKYAVRDQFGVKPLYYFRRGDFITICSEPSVIKEIFSLTINQAALEEYHAVRAPIFQGAFYKSVESLAPGTCLVNGTYFDVLNELCGEYKPVCLDSLLAAVDRGVQTRLVSDVKVGLLLSRGIDSNLIRSRFNFDSLYTIGFDADEDLTYLESQALQRLTISRATKRGYINKFEELLELRQEPLSVPNEVLLSLIGSTARNDGVKVLLSGEGADEFFGGYDRIFSWAAQAKEFNLDQFLALYCYGEVPRHCDLYQKFQEIFENLILPNVFECVRWFFIRYHMPVLFRRLDFSLMAAGIEGREPIANIHLFNEAKTMGPTQLMGNNIGKLPLREISASIYGRDFAYEKKIGFPVDIKRIYNDSSARGSYEIWFDKNGEVLR